MRRAKRPALRLDVETASQEQLKRICVAKASNTDDLVRDALQSATDTSIISNSGDNTPVLDSPTQSGLIPSPGFPAALPSISNSADWPPPLRRGGSSGSGLSQGSAASGALGCLSPPSPSSPAIQPSSSMLYVAQHPQHPLLVAAAVTIDSKCRDNNSIFRVESNLPDGNFAVAKNFNQGTKGSGSCKVPFIPGQAPVDSRFVLATQDGVEKKSSNINPLPSVVRIGSSRYLTFASNLRAGGAHRSGSTSDAPCSKYLAGRSYKVWDSSGIGFKLCQPLTIDGYRHFMALNERLRKLGNESGCSGPVELSEVLDVVIPQDAELVMNVPESVVVYPAIGKSRPFAYLIAACSYGDLHSYIRERKRLPEADIKNYFQQIVRMTAFCHARGVLLRDMKLRKFVFANPEKTIIRLDNIVDLRICPTRDDDWLTDRHGCPAYVSPELLAPDKSAYAGRPADIWSLGVLLFVMSFGRYPFYDPTPSGLFSRIRLGQFCIPREANSSIELRFLVCCLLRHDPSERPKAEELLALHWFSSRCNLALCGTISTARKCKSVEDGAGDSEDAVVPLVDVVDD